jgi:hypothetical protein
MTVERHVLIRRLALLGVLVLATLPWAGPAGAFDSPTLIWNKQIGDVRLGESRDQVNYHYGADCIAGCPGIFQDKGDAHHTNTIYYRYRAHGGSLTIGYVNNRVVYLHTDTVFYRSVNDVGVGTRIPLGACKRRVWRSREYSTGRLVKRRYCLYRWRDFYASSRLAPYCTSVWRTFNHMTTLFIQRGRVTRITVNAKGYSDVTDC